MVQIYGLKEVRFPEEKYVGKGPKCNLFMSPEFQNPNIKANAKTTALVLIQNSGDIRAGQWS